MRLSVNQTEIFTATGGKPFDASLPTVVFLHGSGLDHRSFALKAQFGSQIFSTKQVLLPLILWDIRKDF